MRVGDQASDGTAHPAPDFDGVNQSHRHGNPLLTLRQATISESLTVTNSPIDNDDQEEADTLSPLRPGRRPTALERTSSPASGGPTAQEIEGEIIGERKYHLGAYADVWRGKWIRPDGVEVSVAIKYLRCVKMATQTSAGPELEAERIDKRLKREVWAWEKLVHPNITPLLGYKSGEEPLLITPYYINGNLIQYLKSHPDAPRLKLLIEAANGLVYLHGLTPVVVHGDIKPDNVLVNDTEEASLCDFGLARIIQEMRTGLTTSGQGQGGKGFTAPELLDCEDGQQKSTESDVYAFGGLILSILSGESPFYHLSVSQTITSMCLGKAVPKDKHPSIPADAILWTLMQKCWRMKPTERPTMRDVLAELREEEAYHTQTGTFRAIGQA